MYRNRSAFAQVGWDYLAASHLAMQVFNERDTTVVPELGQYRNCPLQFPMPDETSNHSPVFDGAFDGDVAVKTLWQTTQDSTKNICAVLGPFDGKATVTVAGVTSALELPHIFYSAEIDTFANGPEKNVIATVMSPRARAERIQELLLQSTAVEDPRRYLAVIHYGRAMSSDLAEELSWLAEKSARDSDLGSNNYFIVHDFQFTRGKKARTEIAVSIKAKGINTILINTDHPKSLDSLADALDEQGMLTNDYVYILSPMTTPTDQRLALLRNGGQPDSPLDKLLSGALVMDQLDGFTAKTTGSTTGAAGSDKEDAFLRLWKEQNATLVDQLNAQHPLSPGDDAYWQAPPDYFQKGNTDTGSFSGHPSNLASFVFDAVMSLGVGGCRTLANQDNNASAIGLVEMMEGIMSVNFMGVSGQRLRFAQERHYRRPDDITMGLYNIRGHSRKINSTMTVRDYQAILTHTWTSPNGWAGIPGSRIEFRDGSTNFPAAILNIEENHLPTGVRIFGLSLFGASSLFVVASALFIVMFRNNEIIRKAQPFFLLLLCLGSFITNGAIVALSWDEGAGASPSQLDNLCTTTPWLFFVGHITTFMALATKLWRLAQVMQFRRRKVTVKQVLGPLALLISLAMMVLVLWTILDPWQWERTVIQVIPAETYGRCRSENTWFYAGPLVGLLVTAELCAGWFAVQARNFPEDLSDGRSVLLAIFVQLQAWGMGIPILGVLDDSSASAVYMGRVLLIAAFSTSGMVLLVLPKIWAAVRNHRLPDSQKHRGTIRVSGLNHSTAPGASVKSGGSTSNDHLSSFKQLSSNMNGMEHGIPECAIVNESSLAT